MNPSRQSRAAGPIRGLLLDLDGTVYHEGGLLPGAREALESLRRAALPFRFVTNTTRQPRGAVLARLQELGIPAGADEILTAPMAAAAWLRERGARRVMLLLPEATREEFQDFQVTEEEAEYVVVGDLGTAWNYEILNRAFRALTQAGQGARLVAIHRNRYWEKEDGLGLDVGPFVAALEYATGQEAVVVGKPSPAFFHAAVQDLGLSPGEVAMVGDDLESDVLGAQAAGLRGVLVRTGKYRPERDREREAEAYAVLDSIAKLPGWMGLMVRS